jgi:hypothetical protein
MRLLNVAPRTPTTPYGTGIDPSRDGDRDPLDVLRVRTGEH